MGYFIKVSCAKMPTKVKAPYRHVALMECDAAPTRISYTDRNVRRVIAVRRNLFCGRTDKCATKRAIAELSEIKARLEYADLCEFCGIVNK